MCSSQLLRIAVLWGCGSGTVGSEHRFQSLKPRFEPYFCHLLNMWSWTSHLTSLGTRYLICKMKTIHGLFWGLNDLENEKVVITPRDSFFASFSFQSPSLPLFVSPCLLPSHAALISSHPTNTSPPGLLAYLDIHLHDTHSNLSSANPKALIQTKEDSSPYRIHY